MAKIGSLIADIGLNTARFKSGVRETESGLKGLAKKAKRTFDGFNKAAGRAATAMIALAGAGFGAAIKSNLALADQMQKLNLRLGVSTEALSQMKFAAEQSGIQFNTLTMAMQRAQRRIAEASKGTGEAKDALRELGLSAQALNQMSPDQQLMAISDAMTQLGDSGDKTRLAMKLFDSEGVAMIQMLGGGSAAVRELMAEADKLGLTLNNKTAQGAAQANDAINRFKSAIHGAALEAVTNLSPVITEVANTLSEVLPEAANLAVEAFYKLRERLLGVLADIVAKIGAWAQDIAELATAFDFTETAAKAGEIAKFFALFSKNLRGSAREAAITGKKVNEVNREIQEMVANPVPEGAATAAFSHMQAGIAEVQEQARKLGETLKVNVFDEAMSAGEQLKNQFANVVKDMINTLISSGIKDIIGMIFGMGKKGGLLAGIGKLFGFANGGSFEVGGRGGTDNNIVAFRASRGERVTVQTPNQQRQGGGAVVFNNSYDFRGSSLNEIEVRQMISESQQVTKRQIQNEMIRGRL